MISSYWDTHCFTSWWWWFQNQVDQTIIASHLDDDGYIDDELLTYVLDVIYNPYNDYKGLDIDFDIHDSRCRTGRSLRWIWCGYVIDHMQ